MILNVNYSKHIKHRHSCSENPKVNKNSNAQVKNTPWYKNGIKFSSYKRCSFQQYTVADFLIYCPRIIRRKENLISGQNSAIRPIIQTANWMTCASKWRLDLSCLFLLWQKLEMAKPCFSKRKKMYCHCSMGKVLPFEL